MEICVHMNLYVFSFCLGVSRGVYFVCGEDEGGGCLVGGGVPYPPANQAGEVQKKLERGEGRAWVFALLLLWLFVILLGDMCDPFFEPFCFLTWGLTRVPCTEMTLMSKLRRREFSFNYFNSREHVASSRAAIEGWPVVSLAMKQSKGAPNCKRFAKGILRRHLMA